MPNLIAAKIPFLDHLLMMGRPWATGLGIPPHSTTLHQHAPLRPLKRRFVAPFLSVAIAHPALAAGSSFAEGTMVTLQSEERTAGPVSYDIDSTLLPRPLAPIPARGGLANGFNATEQLALTHWFQPGGRHIVGISFGWTSAAPARHAPTPQTNAAPQSLDLGIRLRSRFGGGRHLDIYAWAQTPEIAPLRDAMGMIWEKQQPTFGTRVEVQWASSRTRGLVPEFGAIGVQLQGDSRLVLRAKKGGPMLYYRAKF